MAYKFRSSDLEDKIKYVKPNSFFESVRKKFQKPGRNYRNLEENEEILNKEKIEKDIYDKTKRVVEETYGNHLNFLRKVHSKTVRANRIEENKKVLITESYNVNVFTEKAKKDMIYFKTLFESTFEDLPETFSRVKDEAINLFESALHDVIDLYKETNTKPRYINNNLNQVNLSESEIVKTYNNHFKHYLQENYLKPLFNHDLNETTEVKKFVKFLTENGQKVNLEDVITYLGFEQSVKGFMENVLIPENSKRKVQLFTESQDPMYFETFDRNAKTLQESIEDKLSKIASLISPFMFKNTVDAEMDHDPIKYAGVSMVCKKVNDGPMVCTVSKKGNSDDSELKSDIKDIDKIDDDIDKEIKDDIDDAKKTTDDLPFDDDDLDDVDANVDPGELLKDELEAQEIDDAIDDKDHDGKKDSEEDHGELPDDFEGDHKDAEKEKKGKKKDLKESQDVLEKGDEPGNPKIQGYNTRKALDKIDKQEEIVKDDASGVRGLGDSAKYEKK